MFDVFLLWSWGVPALLWRVFVRKKQNKSGVVSIQIINKARGKYQVVKTIGSSSDGKQIEQLYNQAREMLPMFVQQSSFNFEGEKERDLSDLFFLALP